MAIVLNPYLQFNGNAEAALDFYKGIFGGEATVSRFSDVPNMPGVSNENKNLLMHADLQTDSLRLMLSDAAPEGGATIGGNVSISLSGTNEEDAMLSQHFEALSDGGNITEPLKTAPWGDKFGMVTDKFGTAWLVNIAAPKS